MTDDQLLTLEQFAEMLQKTPQVIYSMRHRGEGPRSMRIGRTIRYRRSDVLAWFEEQAK